MQGEIITIGDELISGRVCDLNSFFLSARVSSYGLKIRSLSSVGDDETEIVDVLTRAVKRSDFVLVSGGLGSTDDDITARVAARFFGLTLDLDEFFLDAIRQSLNSRGLPWAESYRKLAMIPKGAKLIDPHEACGFYLEYGNVPVFFLPGIPAEVQYLAETRVLPLLMARSDETSVVRQRLFKLFGIQEGEVGDIMAGVGDGEAGLMIGFYPNFPENHLTVTVRGGSERQVDEALDRVESEVQARLGTYVVARDDRTIEQSVGDRLKSRGLRVAVAESCTGGRISARLTSVPGSSDYFDRGIVAYSNEAKMEILGVPEETILKYGAVSAETAAAMAQGVLKNSHADLSVASTGIAGPSGGSEVKPVGTVYLGMAAPEGVRTERFQFGGNRDQITTLTAQTALSWLHLYLEKEGFINEPPQKKDR